MQESIVILFDVHYFPSQALRLGTELAISFDKSVSLLSLASNTQAMTDSANIQLEWKKKYKTPFLTHCLVGTLSDLPTILSNMEASILIIDLTQKAHFYHILSLLKACRDLRIPYIFIKEAFSHVSLKTWLIPISFLPEEKEKGVIAAAFGRRQESSFDLLVANDFGTRAALNANAIQTLLTKFAIPFRVTKGQKDSFSIQQEAVRRASQGEADAVILTASREYGLDDLIFGPPEQRIIAKSRVPLLFLNPRSDLHVLCG